jgi:putative oxygen-independent coproporphyrinogen III oxidase
MFVRWDEEAEVASLYVHFPWCLAKCPYCDFVSYATGREAIDHDGYADAVLREAAARRHEGVRVESIFVGGGTPSLWSARSLGRVLRELRATYDVSANAEVTVECNPTSLDRDAARALVDVGVNRLSIGTQSLRNDQLRYLGRLHDADGASRAVAAALEAGVPRVSTDLIFGLPDQAPEDAREQAVTLASSGIEHLSCYQLTIEPGTQFGERKKRGLLRLADDGKVAEAFLAIDEALEALGFRHYEISNYGRAGCEARHNYVGLGCGAFGFVRSGSGGVRYRNAIVPAAYDAQTRAMTEADRASVPAGFDRAGASVEPLSAGALLEERIMLGLRMIEGVDLARAARDLGIDPWTRERARTVEHLVERGRLVRNGDVLAIPRGAWLFTDDTAARLF